MTAGQIRDLPLARWESAARAHVSGQLRRRADDALARIAELASPETLVRHLYPGLAEATSPADKRRYRGLVQLASVALDYTAKQLDGLADPAAAIARDRDVNPSTVRSWLHRARKAGLLPK